MPLLSFKLRNMLPAGCTSTLKNVLINGDKRGCIGFIQRGDAIVYVNTAQYSYDSGMLVRTAKSLKDYTGGHNQFAKTSEALVKKIEELLKQG